jgi:hypothetical protein
MRAPPTDPQGRSPGDVNMAAPAVKAYVEPVAVGDLLTDMPLFLMPGAHVLAPLETTYMRAFTAMPRRWRSVLETD